MPPDPTAPRSQGKAYLVGAGPGDPELLTLKAARLLKAADVVIYDRLVSDAIMALVPERAHKIFVGKLPRHHPIPQEQINALLLEHVRKGQNVVRLKGGDPFIFSRGGEEALVLRQNHVPFEVVPGVTAAQGAAAALKLPLTMRQRAHGLHYITGHAHASLSHHWQSLCAPHTTLVIYMGLTNIQVITQNLLEHGMPPATPALMIENATLPQQQVFPSSLQTLAQDALKAQPSGPVLFIIGTLAEPPSPPLPTSEISPHRSHKTL